MSNAKHEKNIRLFEVNKDPWKSTNRLVLVSKINKQTEN